MSYNWELINLNGSPILCAFDLHKSNVPPDYETLIAERYTVIAKVLNQKFAT